MMLAMVLVTLVAAAPSLSAPQGSSVKLSSPSSTSASFAFPQQVTQERINPDVSFKYQYYVESTDTGDEKSHQEALEDGVLVGTYSLVQPDGTLRTVNYRADDSSGFKAEVQFQEGYADPLLQQQARLTQGTDITSRLVGVGSAGDVAAPTPTSPHTLAQHKATFNSRFAVGSERFQGTADSTQAQGAIAGVASQGFKVMSGAQGGRLSDASPSHREAFGSKDQRESPLARGTSSALAQKESTLGSGATDSQTHQESVPSSGTNGAQPQQESTFVSETSDLPPQQDSTSSSSTSGPHGSVISGGSSFTAGSSVSAASSTGTAHQFHGFGSSSSGRTSTHSVQIQSSRSGENQSESSLKGGTLTSFSSSSSPSSSSSSSSFSSSSVIQLSKAPHPISATFTKGRVSGSHFAKKKDTGAVELTQHGYDGQTYSYRLSLPPSTQ